MNAYLKFSWQGIVFWGIMILILALVAWFRDQKERRRRGLVVLGLWKENQLPHFLAHTHLNPVVQFGHIEKLVGEYGYSENDLGISLNALLGHAVICQRLQVARLKQRLEGVRRRIESVRDDKTLPFESFIARMRVDIADFDGLQKKVDEEEGIYEALNERWIRSNGRDPKDTLRIDIGVPQAV